MKPLIVANWKCNPSTFKEAELLFRKVKFGIKNIKNLEIVICPPFLYFPYLLKKSLKETISFGAQDCFWGEGAFTGEISPQMLKNLGVKYVILGHSERRRYLKETDEIINKKIKMALKTGLRVILCIEKVSQVKEDLKGIKNFKLLNIAYEPVFAIGTGKPCPILKAKKMKNKILKNLKKKIPILYGGSVDSKLAKDYLQKGGFQGLLVGGASLKPKEFLKIIKKLTSIKNSDILN